MNLKIDNLPAHVAVIMDGNGRWAQSKGFSRIQGHRKGVKSVRSVITYAAKIGIQYLTLYSFSIENWKRPSIEIKALMTLLRRYLIVEEKELNENNIRLKVIGQINDLPENVQNEINRIVKNTSNNSGLTLTLALSYGSRQEIFHAIQKILIDYKDQKILFEDLKIEDISRYLYTKDLPDPDLLIRTSGEMRISNFLLWQISYAEMWVTPKMWPDFNEDDFEQAIIEYSKRNRRFGAV